MSEPFTEERLAAIPSLRREITRTKRRLAELRRRAEGGGAAELETAIAATRAELEGYLLHAQREEAEMLGYIRSIEDTTLREIFMLRYYDGVRPWQKIAFMVGEYDESLVRKRAKAYFKKTAGH